MQVDYTKLNPEKIKENISLLKTQVTKKCGRNGESL